MLVTAMLGADKTTVSVGTGPNEFYPMYFLLKNLTNQARRAHRKGFSPMHSSRFRKVVFSSLFIQRLYSFECQPRASSKNDIAFRTFRRQLYHASISAIMQPPKPSMTTPEVVLYYAPTVITGARHSALARSSLIIPNKRSSRVSSRADVRSE